MKLDELFDTVLKSRGQALWSEISIWGVSGGPLSAVFWRETRKHGSENPQPRTHGQYFVHRDQVELSLAWGFELEEWDERGSAPDWAERLLGGPPVPFYADILWNGAPVMRTLLWRVDGGRGYIPNPKAISANAKPGETAAVERWEVHSLMVRFADVLYSIGGGGRDHDTEYYCNQAGLTILNQSRFW